MPSLAHPTRLAPPQFFNNGINLSGGILVATGDASVANLNATGIVGATGAVFGIQGVFGNSNATGGALVLQNTGGSQALQIQKFTNPVGGTIEAQFDVNGSATFFTDDFGNTVAKGTKSAAVPLTNGNMVKVFSMESPEVWFEDFGAGQLGSGITTVALDRSFLQTVGLAKGYHVFVTPKGDCNGLYVSNQTSTSFEVRELNRGQSNVAFDYRIVGHRKGFEATRLPAANMPTAAAPGAPAAPTAPTAPARHKTR